MGILVIMNINIMKINSTNIKEKIKIPKKMKYLKLYYHLLKRK